MAGLVQAIHATLCAQAYGLTARRFRPGPVRALSRIGVDGRDKPGHDDAKARRTTSAPGQRLGRLRQGATRGKRAIASRSSSGIVLRM